MNCSTWEDFSRHTGFRSVLSLQIGASIFSGILSVVVIAKSGNLSFHVNCKILILVMLYFYLLHSIVLGGLQGYQMFGYLTISDVCHFAVPANICFFLRFSLIFCMVCFADLQVAMVIERSVALWKRKNYEKFGRKLGFALAAFSFLAAFAITAWTVRRAEYSDKPYCSSSTPATLERVAAAYIIVCGIGIAALIGVVLLFTTNRIAVKKKRFDLTSSYQLNENYTVIRVLLPLAVFHSICYIFFTSLSAWLSSHAENFDYVTFRILSALIYIIPIYTAISQIMIWFITNYSKRLKTTRLNQATQPVIKKDDVYFSGYSKMWK